MFILSETGIIYNTNDIERIKVIEDRNTELWAIAAEMKTMPIYITITTGYTREEYAQNALIEMLGENLIRQRTKENGEKDVQTLPTVSKE